MMVWTHKTLQPDPALRSCRAILSFEPKNVRRERRANVCMLPSSRGRFCPRTPAGDALVGVQRGIDCPPLAVLFLSPVSFSDAQKKK